MTRIKYLLIVLFLSGAPQLFSQQWFVKQWQIADGIPPSFEPDFEPCGSTMSGDDVILYGTIGFTQNYLPGAHGRADLLIMKNDEEGNNIWAFTLGTAEEDEHISRVVEVNNDLFIMGHFKRSYGFDAFIMKAEVVSAGSSYSMNILHQPLVRTNAEFYDLAYAPRVDAGGGFADTEPGMAVCGYDKNEQKPFVFRCDMSLGFNTPRTWLKYYINEAPEFELRSLLAIKEGNVDEDFIGGGVPGSRDDEYFTTLVVCGEQGDGGLILKLSTGSGAIIDQFGTYRLIGSNCVDQETQEPLFNLGLSGAFEYGFTEIIQVGDGDLVALGQNGIDGSSTFPNYTQSLFRISKDLNSVKWFSSVGEEYQSADDYPILLDLLKTNMGFAVVSKYFDDSQQMAYTFTHFNDNGHFLIQTQDRIGGILHALIHSRLDPLDKQATEWSDFALQCGNFIHYPAFQHRDAPFPNWNEYNVVHAKTGLEAMKLGCVEEEISPRFESFCDEISLDEDSFDFVQEGSTFSLDAGTDLEWAEQTANFEEVCASSCTESCQIIQQAVFVCEDEIINVILNAPSGWDAGSTYWNDGTTGLQLEVNRIGDYYAYSVTPQGCLEMVKYTVAFYPRPNFTVDVTDVECHGDVDGEICITSDIQFNQIGGIGPNGSFGQGLLSPVSSYCITDLIGNSVPEGIYRIDITDINGCTWKVVAEVSAPDPIAITSNQTPTTSGCDGSIEFIVTGGTPGFNYTLTLGGSIISSGTGSGYYLFSSLCPGIYTFAVSDQNQCTDQNTIEVGDGENKTDGETSIRATLDALTIYPNPTNGLLTIQLPATITGEVEVTDVIGRTVSNHSFTDKDRIDLDLTGQPTGSYFVKVSSAGLSHMEKVIVIE